METRVTYRASEETVKRLQALSEKYGISQSALLTMLVNERWLAEHRVSFGGGPSVSAGKAPNEIDLEPPDDFPNYVPGRKKRKRKH